MLQFRHSVYITQPANTILGKDLHRWLQSRLMQTEIVYSTYTHEDLAGVPLANPVHKRATCGTEVVGHGFSRGNGVRLAEDLEIFATAYVLQMRLGNREVGCKHGCCYLSTVKAVADELCA